eukprot:COSAG05_NODE_193_length_14574_cov_23.070812_11_plen_126_part_00
MYLFIRIRIVAGWQEILDSISHLHAFSRELSAISIRRVKSTDRFLYCLGPGETLQHQPVKHRTSGILAWRVIAVLLTRDHAHLLLERVLHLETTVGRGRQRRQQRRSPEDNQPHPEVSSSGHRRG